jgi:uncharacterized protein
LADQQIALYGAFSTLESIGVRRDLAPLAEVEPHETPAPGEVKSPAAQELNPISALERIELLDILRGFALFGVLVTNMKGFSLPMDAYFGFDGVWPGLTSLDKGVDDFILIVAKGKFIALFSFLFGLGLSIQLARAQAKGVNLVPRYIRRLLVLLVIGFGHVGLFWFGDILHTYALVGFLLILFRNFSERALARIIVIVTIVVMLNGFGRFIVRTMNPLSAGGITVAQHQKQQLDVRLQHRMNEELRIVSVGTYSEQIQLHIRQWAGLYANPGVLVRFGLLLHLFLMGLYIGKRRVLQDIPGNLPFLRKCMWFGLACGIGELVRFLPPLPDFPAAGFVRGMIGSFSQYVFFFYAAGIAILVHRSSWWRGKFGHLAPVGRMALTNYLTQTLVASAIFYGWGLGYFGKMGSAWGLALSCAIFAAQIPFSAWWLRRYQFGPVEWVWRFLTYGRMPAMKLKVLPKAAVA